MLGVNLCPYHLSILDADIGEVALQGVDGVVHAVRFK